MFVMDSERSLERLKVKIILFWVVLVAYRPSKLSNLYLRDGLLRAMPH